MTGTTTTGELTIRESAIKHGLTPIPPGDPIYQNGFTIGATKSYRQRPAGSTTTESSTAPNRDTP